MATANVSPLKDIDEKFLQCHICLNRLKDPKIFPCLHHYCRDCLDKILKKVLLEPTEGDEEKVIECPVCRQRHHIPENGVEGIKTDFNTNNIIEFIELYDSVKHEPSKVCIQCNQEHKATGYCFKCNDFLCEGCHEFHLNNPVVKDHRPHVFSLNETEVNFLTVEKLASLKEAPRCSKHPTKLSELCCSTCRNLPICVPCTFGAHKGHDLQEVSVLAGSEREKLTTRVEELRKNNQRVYETQEMLNSANEILFRAAEVETTRLQEEHDNVEKEIKIEQLSNREVITRENEKVQEMLKEKLNKRKLELDEEVNIARDKYDRACKEDKKQADIVLAGLRKRDEAKDAELKKKKASLSTKLKEVLTSLQHKQQQQATRIEQMVVHFNDIVRRFENVKKMASSVLAAKDDWTDVQCIPDINAAIDPLMEEVRKGITTNLKSLTTLEVQSKLSGIEYGVHITEEEESVVNIDAGGEWNVDGIAGSEMAGVVVTGARTDKKKSLISVNDMEGVQLRREEFLSKHVLWRFCCILSGYSIVTACFPSEIGVYDGEDGKYNNTDVGHVVRKDHEGWYIRCLAVDHSNHNIIVGCDHKKEVYIFDRNVKYISTLTLPNSRPSGPRNIAVHGTNLLVCEYATGAYAAAMGSSVCEQLYEFSRPIVDGRTYSSALCVCVDGNSHIYMLWSQTGKVIAQYTPDGRQLLTTRCVDNGATCITTAQINGAEKLLLATRITGKIYVYGLSRGSGSH